jgi:hypothetical protein
MSKIEIPTAEMDIGEGAVMRLLLCKDAKKLDMALAHLETTDIGDNLYLAHAPDMLHSWEGKDMSQETPIGVSCRLCQQPIYRWTNDF